MKSAWAHFRRARARFDLRWYDRPGLLLGGLRLLWRGLTRDNAYLLNMGARALGMAVHPRGPKPPKPR